MNSSTLVERWQFLQAINADPDLSASAKSVAFALMAFVNSETGACFPSFDKIMAACHVSKATVVRSTRALESCGWVTIERDHGGDRESNRYHFAFERARDGSSQAAESTKATKSEEFHGVKIEPCSDVHGVKSAPSMVSNFSGHGVKIEPELEGDKTAVG